MNSAPGMEIVRKSQLFIISLFVVVLVLSFTAPAFAYVSHGPANGDISRANQFSDLSTRLAEKKQHKTCIKISQPGRSRRSGGDCHDSVYKIRETNLPYFIHYERAQTIHSLKTGYYETPTTPTYRREFQFAHRWRGPPRL